jgi:hypothetical protein
MRSIKILVFLAFNADEQFIDEWQVNSPSLHGVLACISAVAHTRCHDHCFFGEHLEKMWHDAKAAGDAYEAERLQRRMRTAFAFARGEVVVYAQTAPADIDEHTTASRWPVARFPHGMLALARHLDEFAWQHVGGYIEPLAEPRLRKLSTHPTDAAAFASLLHKARTALAMEKQADARGDATGIDAPSEAQIATEAAREAHEAAIEAALARDLDDVSPEELVAAAAVFDAIESESVPHEESQVVTQKTAKARKAKT